MDMLNLILKPDICYLCMILNILNKNIKNRLYYYCYCC